MKILEELELHIRLNEDDWSRNPQVQFERFIETINVNQLDSKCGNVIPWISINDKLPPEEEEVFVYAKSNIFVYYGVGYLCEGIWMDGEFAKIDDYEVSHWMPLIEPKLK